MSISDESSVGFSAHMSKMCEEISSITCDVQNVWILQAKLMVELWGESGV